MRLDLWRLLLLTTWAAITALILAPSGSTFGLPEGFRVGDVVWAGSVGLLGLVLIRWRFVPRPPRSLPLAMFVLYIAAVLILPLVGLLVLDAPVRWYLGDLRWLQVLTLMTGLWIVYTGAAVGMVTRHFVTFTWVLVVFQYPFVLAQVGLGLFGWPPPRFLDLWYPNGESVLGVYGQHIGRYAGALNTASALALVGGLGVMTAFIRLIITPMSRDLLLLGLSGVLLVAAGNRAMMIVVPTLLVALYGVQFSHRGVLKLSFVRLLAVAIPIAVVAGVVAFRFNLGRIATSDRYVAILDWMRGGRTAAGLTGRGEARWSAPIQEAFSDWTPFGTLVNSSHALEHLPTIDSYIVAAVAQGGVMIILPFLVLMTGLGLRGVVMALGEQSSAVPVLAGVGAILGSAATQNTMTGLLPRFLLMLAVLALLIHDRKRGVTGDRIAAVEHRYTAAEPRQENPA